MVSEAEKKHLTKMQRNELHDKKKACVIRHVGRDACDYPKNGYDVSKTARKDMYNKEINPADIDETKFDEDVEKGVSKRRRRRREGKYAFLRRVKKFRAIYGNSLKKAYIYSRDLLQRDPRAWFIGDESPDPTNFLPRHHKGKGWDHPYYHNWHHLIPNGAIREYIGSGEDGYKCLFLLMTSTYNINSEENVVLLPKDAFVGRALGLPLHCPYFLMEHKDYQQTCKIDLDSIKQKLQKVLDEKGKPHKLNDETVVRVKKQMEELSETLLWLIRQMQPGESIDQKI